jgi:hypothetical protein
MLVLALGDFVTVPPLGLPRPRAAPPPLLPPRPPRVGPRTETCFGGIVSSPAIQLLLFIGAYRRDCACIEACRGGGSGTRRVFIELREESQVAVLLSQSVQMVLIGNSELSWAIIEF